MVEKTPNSASFLIGKNILLDTCFIAKFKDNKSCFKDLLFLFNEKNCATTTHSFIENEFLRGSSTNSYIKEKKEFLNRFNFFNLPITEEIIKNSILISNIYSNKNVLNNQISIVDCINAAFLMKHYKDLFLITLDNKDYPIFVFDRIYIYTIDVGKEIFNCGFYKFNIDKFEKAKKEFLNT